MAEGSHRLEIDAMINHGEILRFTQNDKRKDSSLHL